MPATRPPPIPLAALALLVGLTVYLAACLGAAIRSTRSLEQDSAHYCEVVERARAGLGFTSQCDRRGPVDEPAPPPQPFRAANRWPWFAAGICAITGEVPQTMMFTALAALLAAVWLAAWTIRRGVGATWPVAALCVAGALCHKRSLEAAALPLSDSPSLLLNIAVLAALTAGRRPRLLLALALTALACLVRFQNVALFFPLAYVLLPRPPRHLALAAGLMIAVGFAGGRALAGTAAFVLPWEPASLLRATRWMFPSLVAGLLLGPPQHRRATAGPLLWLLLGHFAVLLANEDTSRDGGWLFGLRHGWPFHFVAAALAARAITLARGPLRLLLIGTVCVAAGEQLPRAWALAEQRAHPAGRAAYAAMLSWLRDHELPADAVVFSHQADALARELRVATVHSRGFPTDDPDLPGRLRRRRVTHMLLTWAEMPMLEHHDQRMTAFAQLLEPDTVVVHEEQNVEPPASRALLLRWRTP